MLGVAFTIGTGFFLGSHLAIEIGGPAILDRIEPPTMYLYHGMKESMLVRQYTVDSFIPRARKALRFL